MNWDDLKILLAIARSGSLSRAAIVLDLDQSTVGRRLSALEAALGTILFKRSRAGLTLTDAGDKLMPFAREIEKSVDQMVEDASDTGEGPTGMVRVLSNAWILHRIAEKVLPGFLARHPGIMMRMISHRPLARVSEDATLSLWFEAPPEDGDLAIALGEVPFAVYALKHANPDDLDWVSFYDEDAPNRAPVRMWKRQRSGKDQLRLTGSDASILQTSIRSGLGKGYLPMCLGEADPLLARVEGNHQRLDRMMHLHVHPDTMQSNRVQATMSAIRETFTDVFLP